MSDEFSTSSESNAPSLRSDAAVIFGAGFLHAAIWAASGMLFSFPSMPGAGPLSILSSLFIAIVLSFLVQGLTGPRLQVAIALWAFWFVVAHANTLVEAFVFQLAIPDELAPLFVIIGLLSTLAVTPLLIGRFLRKETAETPQLFSLPAKVSSWLWRILLGVLAYIVLYGVAGSIIFPYVLSFYETKSLPSLDVLLVVQFFRGLAFVLVAIPLVRYSTVSRWRMATVFGACYSVLGGIAPLIIPNPYFPDDVRYVHLGEVGISNFVFGVVVALLLTRSRRSGE